MALERDQDFPIAPGNDSVKWGDLWTPHTSSVRHNTFVDAIAPDLPGMQPHTNRVYVVLGGRYGRFVTGEGRQFLQDVEVIVSVREQAKAPRTPALRTRAIRM
jgi:hypothetical protein